MKRGMYYRDGYFPFPVQVGEEWDQTTFAGHEPAKDAAGTGMDNAWVVGAGTHYPIGFSIEEAAKLFWRVKGFSWEAYWKLTEVRGLFEDVYHFVGELPLTEFPASFVCDTYDPPEVDTALPPANYGLAKEGATVTAGLRDFFLNYAERNTNGPDHRRFHLMRGNGAMHTLFQKESPETEPWASTVTGFSLFFPNGYSQEVSETPAMLRVGSPYYPRLNITTAAFVRSWYDDPFDPPVVPTFADASIGVIFDSGTTFATSVKEEEDWGHGRAIECAEITCEFAGREVMLYRRELQVDPPFNTQTLESGGFVRINPAKYWTYGGIYDEDTGAPV